MTGAVGKIFSFASYKTVKKGITALSDYFTKTKQIKMFKNAFNETHFADELSKASSEWELVTMVDDFVKNHQEIFKTNPKAYTEFCEIIKQRVAYIRQHNTVCSA
jgi:hypothetical protein